MTHPRTSITVSHTKLDTPLHPQVVSDTNRQQQTSPDTGRHCQTPPNRVVECLRVSVWCLLVSVGVCWCLFVSGKWRGVWRGVCGVSGWYFGMSEVLKYAQGCVSKLNPSGNELKWSNHNVKAWLWNAWFFSPDHIEISKYQNVHTYAFKRRLRFAIS